MPEPLVDFCYHCPPVPYTRYNNAAKYRDQIRRYYDYKADLAACLKAAYGYFAWDIPAPNSKGRSAYLKNNRYDLSLVVYRASDRGDLSNFTKCVEDALQDAGILADDCQIDGYCHPFEKRIDANDPRVEIKLYRRLP